MGKRLDAMTPRPKYNAPGESWWLRVGSAWVDDKGRTTVFLDSYPLPDKEGIVKIMLFEPLPKREPTIEREPQQREAPLNWKKELDDEIPF